MRGVRRATGHRLGQPSDLAHHAVQGRPDRQRRARRRHRRSAAEAADGLLAWEAAAAWWQMAITLAPRGPAWTPAADAAWPQPVAGRARRRPARASKRPLRGGPHRRRGDFDCGCPRGGGHGRGGGGGSQTSGAADQARRCPGVPAGQRARLWPGRRSRPTGSPVARTKAGVPASAAVKLAEQADDTEALGAALIARQFTLRGPDFSKTGWQQAPRCSA